MGAGEGLHLTNRAAQCLHRPQEAGHRTGSGCGQWACAGTSEGRGGRFVRLHEVSLQCWEEGGGGLFTAVPLGVVTGKGSGSEQSASVGGSTDDNLIGSFSEGAGFGGGDSTEVCNVLSWQLVVSQLSSAQATPLSHLSSLYSLSKWALPAKRGKASRMKARREQTVLREGEGLVVIVG